MTEWEEIRETRLHAAAEAAAKAAEEAAALAAAQADAVAEATGIIEVQGEAQPAVVAEAEAIVEEVSEALQTAEIAEGAEPETAPEVVVDVDDDSVLEALIRDEELLKQDEVEAASVTSEAEVGISVDDLNSFTLDEVDVMDDDDEEEPDIEPLDFEVMPVLTPDAGKIRFAEDIVDDSRGGGRRGGGGRSRRGGGGSRRR
jgi:hypothetical protein